MLFKEIVDKIKFSEIKQRIKDLYPDDAKHLKKFEKTLTTLKHLNPKKSDPEMVIIINHVIEENDENWYDVSGYEDNNPTLWGLGITPWEEWLGMEIDSDTEKSYSLQDILVHCLWEMTWYGWTLEDIRKSRLGLNKKVEEIEDVKFNAINSLDDI